MKWFGRSWGAPVCDLFKHVDTPVGWECIRCARPIKEEDAGIVMPFLGAEEDPKECAYHRACFLDSLFGSPG